MSGEKSAKHLYEREKVPKSRVGVCKRNITHKESAFPGNFQAVNKEKAGIEYISRVLRLEKEGRGRQWIPYPL